MNKYKYQFKIESIHIQEKNITDKGMKKWLTDRDLMSSVQKLVGLPISIIFEDSKEFLNEGTFFAKEQAEDKASEAIAILMGITFGGTQKHLSNYREDAEIKGRFVSCKLESIDQV